MDKLNRESGGICGGRPGCAGPSTADNAQTVDEQGVGRACVTSQRAFRSDRCAFFMSQIDCNPFRFPFLLATRCEC